jgi:hypothetical protein
VPIKLKKTQGVLAVAAKPQELQAAWATAQKAAKVLGVASLKKVDDAIWGPKMAGKKAEYIIDGKPENEALSLTVKLHIGSEYSTLGIVKKTEQELKNDMILKNLKLCGLL